jgi:hypothetical protein
MPKNITCEAAPHGLARETRGVLYPFTFVGNAVAVLSAGNASLALTIVATASNVTLPNAASSLVNV